MEIKKNKLIVYTFLYLVIGFYFVRTTVVFDGEIEYHKSVLDKSKEQYVNRVLFPFMVQYTSELLQYKTSYLADIMRIYRFLYIIILASVALLFQKYLMYWFDEKTAVLGTLLLLISIPFSFIITGHIDSLFDLGLFTLSAILIVRNYYLPLIPILFVGAFNRQTIVFVALFYFLAKFNNKNWVVVFFKAGILALIPIITGFVVRYLRDVLDKPSYPNMFLWNVACHHCFISVFVLFNIFWVLAFVGLRKKPFVLQRWVFVIPFFLIIHYLFGFIWETRMFLPLAVILVPLGLFSFYPESVHKISP